eukprot:gene9411-19528_t
MENDIGLYRYNTKIATATGSLNLDFFSQQDDGAQTDDSASSCSCSSCNDSIGITRSKSQEDDLSIAQNSTEHDAFHIDSDMTRELGTEVYDAMDYKSIAAFIAARIEHRLENDSFMACNMTPIINQFYQWKRELPMVEPFYAVKCNPDIAIVRLLASLGCNFDCATMGEMDLVINGLGEELSLGARGLATKSIVYANPAKMANMIKFAMDNEVRMTVFDGEDELRKIAALRGQNKFDLLLRLTTDDKSSVCKFSKKFGCPVEEAPKLLQIAKSLGLHVAGVSFHVGSGCGDSGAYTTALSHASIVFETAKALGMPPMNIVDIGGGFPGDAGGYGGPGMPTFADLSKAIRAGIQSFGASLGRPLSEIRFIAEPGRYFVSASTVLATKVYSRRGGSEDYQALYVDDGVYGSFNNVVYDHYVPVPIKLTVGKSGGQTQGVEEKGIPTAVFGPTCDGLDQMCSLDSTLLPRCEVGDWLIWDNMGAYTHTASYVFNGYSHIPSKVLRKLCKIIKRVDKLTAAIDDFNIWQILSLHFRIQLQFTDIPHQMDHMG